MSGICSNGSKVLCCATADTDIQKCLRGVSSIFEICTRSEQLRLARTKFFDMIGSFGSHKSCSKLPHVRINGHFKLHLQIRDISKVYLPGSIHNSRLFIFGTNNQFIYTVTILCIRIKRYPVLCTLLSFGTQGWPIFFGSLLSILFSE